MPKAIPARQLNPQPLIADDLCCVRDVAKNKPLSATASTAALSQRMGAFGQGSRRVRQIYDAFLRGG